MLRFQEMVPDWYIEKSRDFQVLCRLYDYTMNGVKFNIDTMQSLTDTRTVKDSVLPLVGDKFGIYDKDAYTNRYLLEALPIASKYKGSMKAVNILLNAFLDSMDIFDYALVFHARDEESAKEISEMLHRKISPYSLFIIFSSFPSLTNLRVLNEYINRVIPSGFIIDYGFGVTEEIVESFKYSEFVFLLYTHKQEYIDGKLPYIGFVKNKEDKYFDPKVNEKYESAFSITDISHISSKTELVEGPDDKEIIEGWVPMYRPIPVPPSTEIIVNEIVYSIIDGKRTRVVTPLTPETDGTYKVKNGAYVEYSYSSTAEFIKDTLSDVDINAVGLATVVGGEE